jgi:exopolyphosphatase/guanosine-5'-triphosphate,3'-diphosphate pyrophosphatase
VADVLADQGQVHGLPAKQCASLERTLADRPALSAPAAGASGGGVQPAIAVGGAIDIGSNSVHLVVSLIGRGWSESLRDTSELLGLGDVVDQHGDLPADARKRVIETLRGYQDTAHRSHAERLTLIGTEPLRRARNADVLADEIERETGLKLVVLTEREEAILTFAGVTHGVLPDTQLVVVDIGGGSTEISNWKPGEPLRVDSLPIGSARLTKAMVENDPPTDAEFDRLFQATREVAAGRISLDPGRDAPEVQAIFVGGTATNVARLGRLSRQAIAEDRKTLHRMSVAHVASRYNVRLRRARQLPAGIAIVESLLEKFGLDGADVSDASLRDGAIIAAARYGDGWHDHVEDLVRV